MSEDRFTQAAHVIWQHMAEWRQQTRRALGITDDDEHPNGGPCNCGLGGCKWDYGPTEGDDE